MKEYRVKIEHLEDGIRNGTDYFALSEDEYRKVIGMVVGSDDADAWEEIYRSESNDSN